MSRAADKLAKPLAPPLRLSPTAVLLAAAPAAFAGWRLALPERTLTETGPRALADGAFALAFWAYLLTVGAGLGYTALRLAHFQADNAGDRLRFGVPVGLGLLGFIPLFLGLGGLLHPSWLLGALAGVALITIPAAGQAVGDFRWLLAELGRLKRSPRNCLLAAVYITLAASSLGLALAPPLGYDALWYHLEGPKLFLRAGRVYPEPANWPANYAFAADMLYAFPLALGNDTVPGLLHGTFAVAVLAGGYALARAYSVSTAWLVPLTMLTTGQFASLATQAGTDFVVACFELLGLELVVAHTRRGRPLNLPVLGLCFGLGLATKATAGAGLVAAGAVLGVYLTGRLVRVGRGPLAFTLAGLLTALGVGFVLVLPWYAKNWVWFGHPFFPYAGAAPNQDAGLRMGLLVDYLVHGHGVPRNLAGLAGLPRAIFADPTRFGQVFPPTAFIVLAPFAVFLTRQPPLELLGFLAVRIGLWFLSSQQLRFLIPSLVVIGAVLTIGLARAHPAPVRRIAGRVAVGAVMVLVAYIALNYVRFVATAPVLAVVAGYESKAAYLTELLPGYPALRFIGSLRPGSRVLLVGDARHYYCPETCWPEADQFTWTRLAILAGFDPEELLGTVRKLGITHILVSRPDVTYLTAHDPAGRFGRSVRLLYEELVPRCLRPVFVDRAAEVYELACSG